VASDSNGAGSYELEAGPFSQVLYPIWLTADSGLPTCSRAGTGKNSLIRLWFGPPTAPSQGDLLHCNKTRAGFNPKEFTGELFGTL
jgi:hypothetical protein